MMRYYPLLFWLPMVLLSCAYSFDDGPGYRYDLFKNTPAWELAQAVSGGDSSDIVEEYRKNPTLLNYQEPRSGKTLLMLTVMRKEYSTFKLLLRLGADINIHDTYTGKSAIIWAADVTGYSQDNTEFLKLLLQYGANPNDEEAGPRHEGYYRRERPLAAACRSRSALSRQSQLPKVMLLVAAGADMFYHSSECSTPFSIAVSAEDYNVIMYLIEKGADFREVIVNRNGTDMYIEHMLREDTYPLNSEEHLAKMKLVEMLQQRGVDYWSVPVPESVRKRINSQYKDSQRGKEYLAKY